MSRIAKLSVIAMLVSASLACGLLSSPISGVQNLASTAEAVASASPAGVPNMPDVTGYLNPTGAPVKEWNGIPVMPQAKAGQEFNKTTYSFNVGATTAADVQTFYDDKLKALGWSSQFSGAAGGGAVMAFSKASSVLTITVAQSGSDTIVLLISE